MLSSFPICILIYKFIICVHTLEWLLNFLIFGENNIQEFRLNGIFHCPDVNMIRSTLDSRIISFWHDNTQDKVTLTSRKYQNGDLGLSQERKNKFCINEKSEHILERKRLPSLN